MTREEAIELLKQYNLYSPTKQIEEAIDMAIEALLVAVNRKDTVTLNSPISIQPAMVSVVRCKDCRYRNGKVNRKGFEVCDATRMDITDEDFCSWGERREK